MRSELSGKVILVTGGGRGLGKEIAISCARAGAKVAILARSRRELEQTCSEISDANGQEACTYHCVDVSDSLALKKAVDAINDKWGQSIYGLIAAAGVYGAIGQFLDTPFEEWAQGLDINLKACALSVHMIAPQMVAAGEGRIILFSGGGQGPLPRLSSYTTAKGGIWRFTETIGSELAQSNVFLNAIAPGAINTRFLEDLLKAGEAKTGSELYQKSLKQKLDGGESPQKTCDLCLYLLSEQSSGLYGKTISAIWDNYSEWTNLKQLSLSPQYTYKRVTPSKPNP